MTSAVESVAPRRSSRWRARTTVIIAVLVLLAVSAGLVIVRVRDDNRFFSIPSSAMAPTLSMDDRVRTSKVDSSTEIERGWIVIHGSPSLPVDNVVKRVVALPGDTIEARDGKVFVNGSLLDEPYLAPDTTTVGIPTTTVEPSTFYVLGDNRSESHDSRNYGAVDKSTISRHAVQVVYPRFRNLP